MDVLKMRNITKFAELIVEADLKKSLELSENITIFAPTDEAFSVCIQNMILIHLL